MYPPPEGITESAEQASELDDTFLSSDPFGYFISRIGMLHNWALNAAVPDTADDEQPDAEQLETARVPGRPDLAAVFTALSNKANSPLLPPMVVKSQVALDAFTLRHHVAEAVVRLTLARLEHTKTERAGHASLWATISDNMLTIHELRKTLVREMRALPDAGFAQLVLPPELPINEHTLPAARATVETLAAWVEYAVALLTPTELDTTAAHNKVKHGLAVRGRADLKVTFTTVAPNADGNVSLSAFDPGVAIDIFDRPVLEFLGRPPKTNKVTQGLELTQLRMDYRELLFEAAMMARVHGALFHVAARAHFNDRDIPQGLEVAPHPGLIANSPKPNRRGNPVGMRFPITLPADSGASRTAGIGFSDGTFVPFTITGERTTGQVVDDTQNVEPDAGTERD